MKMIAISLFIIVSSNQFPAIAENSKPNNENIAALNYSVRYGIGGFSESRSPEGSLGGSQIAFDIHLNHIPLSFSVSQESYTNSPEPTHSFEIARMISASVFYFDPFNNMNNFSYYLGLGVSKLNVPRSEISPKPYLSDNAINIASRIHYKISKHLSFYTLVKHLSADKSVNNVNLIDYNDTILLFGLGYNFKI